MTTSPADSTSSSPSPTADLAPAESAAPSRPLWSRYRWFLVIVVICTAFDLATKSFIFSALGVSDETIHAATERAQGVYERRQAAYDRLPEAQRQELPPPQLHIHFDQLHQHVVWQADANLPRTETASFSFTAVLNPGAFGGLLGGQILVLVILSFVAVLIVGWILLRSDLFHFQVVGGLIIAGAFGNIYDRLVFGCVRDFMDFRWPEIGLDIFNPWNTFNFADSCIVIGIISLLVIEFFFPLPIHDTNRKPRSDSKQNGNRVADAPVTATGTAAETETSEASPPATLNPPPGAPLAPPAPAVDNKHGETEPSPAAN